VLTSRREMTSAGHWPVWCSNSFTSICCKFLEQEVAQKACTKNL